MFLARTISLTITFCFKNRKLSNPVLATIRFPATTLPLVQSPYGHNKSLNDVPKLTTDHDEQTTPQATSSSLNFPAKHIATANLNKSQKHLLTRAQIEIVYKGDQSGPTTNKTQAFGTRTCCNLPWIQVREACRPIHVHAATRKFSSFPLARVANWVVVEIKSSAFVFHPRS